MNKTKFTRKERKILNENFKILDKCVGISEDLTQEASERIKKILDRKIGNDNALENLIEALCGRFEEKINKQQGRDMN